jgi:hypothetical protein
MTSENTTKQGPPKYGPTITFRTTPRIAAALKKLQHDSRERSRSRLINEALAKYLVPTVGKRDADHMAPLIASAEGRLK